MRPCQSAQIVHDRFEDKAIQMNDTELNYGTSEAGLSTKVKVKSKRGRKPAKESRSAEIRQRIAAWKLVPYEKRKPVTVLARELGISHQLASHYASQVPSPDPIAEARAIVADALPRMVEMVARETEKRVRERRKFSRDDLSFLRKAARAGNKKAQAVLGELEGGSRQG
jgi:hypothetical protein